MDPKDCSTYIRLFVGGYECRLAVDHSRLSLPPVLRHARVILDDDGSNPACHVEMARFFIAGRWSARFVFDVEDLTTRLMVDSRGVAAGDITWDCDVPGVPEPHFGCYHPQVFECSICRQRQTLNVPMRGQQINGAARVAAAQLTLPKGWTRTSGPTQAGLICDEHGAGLALWEQLSNHVHLDMLPPTDVQNPE